MENMEKFKHFLILEWYRYTRSMNPYTIYIILIWLLIIAIWWRYGREMIGRRVPNPLMKKYTFTPLSLKLIWLVRASIFVSIIALWVDPKIMIERTIREKISKNIIITLDISNSMKTDDVNPDRLSKAKEVVEGFTRKNMIDTIGYTIFAGRAFLMAPLSQDREGLRAMIWSTTTDTIDQSEPDTSGTNIGDALLTSIEALQKTGSWEKIIILMTDGRANLGISPWIAGDIAKREWVKIYAVGIGSKSGSILSYRDPQWVRQYFYDSDGKKMVGDIDEASLTLLASKTWGKYFSAEDQRILESVFEEVDRVVSTSLTYSTKALPTQIAPYLIVLIIVLSGVHALTGRYIRKKYK